MGAARAKRRRATSRTSTAAEQRRPRPAKKKGHGGARPGAGRKQEKLPDELLAELGNPPVDVLQKTEWWNRLLEVLQYGVLKGKPWTTMLRDARANALVASKLVPEEIKARAAAILDREDREVEADASPPLRKLKEDGHASADAESLRRDPS